MINHLDHELNYYDDFIFYVNFSYYLIILIFYMCLALIINLSLIHEKIQLKNYLID